MQHLSTMNLVQLKALAKKMGIQPENLHSRVDYISAIHTAEQKTKAKSPPKRKSPPKETPKSSPPKPDTKKQRAASPPKPKYLSICGEYSRKNNMEITIKKLYFKKAEIKKTQRHLILDNGGYPFQVLACNKGIEIYTDGVWRYKEVVYNENQDIYYIPVTYTKLIKRYTKFLGYWPGYDISTGEHGNNVLIQLSKHKYVYVGGEIYSFKTDDIIQQFASPVGNSSVPYPVAYGTKNCYFMLDRKYIPNSDIATGLTIDDSDELYGEFYELTHKRNKHPAPTMKGITNVSE